MSAKDFLIEEARTNLLTYSNQFDNAAWVKSNSYIVNGAIIAPDGTLTGVKLCEYDDTADVQRTVSAVNEINFISGSVYTMSCYFKSAERTQAFIQVGYGTYFPYVVFDLTSCSVLRSLGVTSASITASTEDWYRCTITITAQETAAGYIQMEPCLNGTGYYSGSFGSGIYICDAQLEVGSFPTSYIHTTSAQVTRAADTAVIDGVNFSQWYKPTEGTVFCDFDVNALGSNAGLRCTQLMIQMLTVSMVLFVTMTLILLHLQFGKMALDCWEVNTDRPVIAKITQKHCISFSNTGTFIAAQNGSLHQETRGSGYLPLNVNSVSIKFLNGHIRRLQYYPKALTATELQAMTAI